MSTKPVPLDVPVALHDFNRRVRKLLALFEPIGGLALTVEVTPGPGRNPPPPAHFGYARVEGLGGLVWDEGWWNGSLDVPAWGRAVKITFDPMEDAPTPPPRKSQVEAVRQFAAGGTALRRRIEEAVLDYYRRIRTEFLDESDEGSRANYPNIKTTKALSKLLSERSLHVPEQSKRGWTVDVCWECEWDPEHGLRATVRDGNVVGVDSQ